MSKDTSGPAFPTSINNPSHADVPGFADDVVGAKSKTDYKGLSVREYAAIKAMPVVLAEAWRNEWDFEGFDSFDQMVARHARLT